jgi:acetyl-CoA carboxylase alpha subunit
MHLKSFDECVLQEPLGGAHSDPGQTSKNIKAVIMKHMRVSHFRYISSSTVTIRLYSLDSYQYYISLS